MMHVAMISGWHVHAKGYAKQLAARPDVEIAAVYDSDAYWENGAEKGRAWAAELGCPFVADYDAILADKNIDAVAVCAPTAAHPDVIIRAAEAGKAVFTEKVLALTARDAYAIRDAVVKNHTVFTISYPHKTNPALLFVKKLADSGALGTLTYARVRNVHSGSIADWLPPHFYDEAACGGGAMIDLGAHPCYTLAWFLGKPVSIQSCFTNVTPRPVEDNAVSLFRYASGAIGVSETGFVSVADPYTFELSGTKGAARVLGQEAWYADEATEKKWIRAEVLPETPKSPLDTWADAVNNGTPVVYGIDEAVTLSEIMDAAYRAAGSRAEAQV